MGRVNESIWTDIFLSRGGDRIRGGEFIAAPHGSPAEEDTR